MKYHVISFICLLVCLFPKQSASQEKIEFSSSKTNTSGNYLVIDAWGKDENRQLKLVLNITDEFKTNNPHPVGLWYSTSLKKWTVYNEDRAAFPLSIVLRNVVQSYGFGAQLHDGCLGYFKVILTPSNIVNNEVVIDNPIVNNNANLAITATHVFSDADESSGMYNADYPAVKYNSTTGKWILYNRNNTALQPGMVFYMGVKLSSQMEALANNNNFKKPGNFYKAPKLKFRVTINGFTCHSATVDHMLEVDGKGDEIFFGAVVKRMEGLTVAGAANSERKWTVRYGDINSEEGRTGLRIKAGSKPGGMGGVQNGDQFPATEAWRRKQAVNPTSLPVLICEGTFNDNNEAVLVVPSIWEFDGTTEEEQALNSFASSFAEVAIRLGSSVVATILVGPEILPLLTISQIETSRNANSPVNGQPVYNLPMFVKLNFKEPVFNIKVNKTLFGDAKDRPVGMEDKGGAYEFTPVGLLLKPDNIIALSNSDFGFGKGVLPLRYKDAPAMQGDYTMYIQVEYKKENENFDDANRVMPYSASNNKPYRLQNVYSSSSLVAGATNAAAMGGAGNFDWYFEQADARFADVFYLKNKEGKYIGVSAVQENMDKNGLAVVCGAKQNNDGYRWKVVSNGDGSYSIINMFAKKALVYDGPTGNILLWENRANPEQRWLITNQ